MTTWAGRKVLVTGGASFIGSHLVDALVARGARVRVVDNLSSGRREHLAPHLTAGTIEFAQADLLSAGVAERAVEGMSLVFHFAASHGGRGYIEGHQTACATNLILDGAVFRACAAAKVEQVVYASSACVYPTSLQQHPDEIRYLSEPMVGPPYEADTLYGWAKLMGELTLQAYAKEQGLPSVSLRYFTAYGERAHESHAIIAMIARAFVRQNPFIVWGTGEQVRSWVHISDIVEGTLAAAECIHDATAINLGTTERVRVIDAAREILRRTGHQAEIELHPEMPTGPLNRAADNALAKSRLGWTPKVPFAEGLARTIDWYRAAHDPEQVSRALPRMLVERTAS